MLYKRKYDIIKWMSGHLKRWLTVLLNFSLLYLEFSFFLTWISLFLEEFIQIRNEWQSTPGLMRELSSCWELQCPARISLKRGSRYQSDHVGKQIKIQRTFYFLFQYLNSLLSFYSIPRPPRPSQTPRHLHLTGSQLHCSQPSWGLGPSGREHSVLLLSSSLRVRGRP